MGKDSRFEAAQHVFADDPISQRADGGFHVKLGQIKTNLSSVLKASSPRGVQAPSYSSSPSAESIAGAASFWLRKRGAGLWLIPGPSLSPDGALASASLKPRPHSALGHDERALGGPSLLPRGASCCAGYSPGSPGTGSAPELGVWSQTALAVGVAVRTAV